MISLQRGERDAEGERERELFTCTPPALVTMHTRMGYSPHIVLYSPASAIFFSGSVLHVYAFWEVVARPRFPKSGWAREGGDD